MSVYGGPNSQTVMMNYDIGFHTYVASQLGYIVASVDGRGTGGRGSVWRKQIYEKLGSLETADQITAAKHLQSMSFVQYVGIWGWSYGGYMTCMIMSDPTTSLKFGMAVAPVTDWKFYDSIYTERYMRTPQENAQGYSQSSVLTRAANIKDNTLLLVHGTADDNVHFENTAELVELLIARDIEFEVMFYTNRDHSISNGARPHLYHLLSKYLQSNQG